MWKYHYLRQCECIYIGYTVYSGYHFDYLTIIEITYHKDYYCNYPIVPRCKLRGSIHNYTHISWLADCENCIYYNKV